MTKVVEQFKSEIEDNREKIENLQSEIDSLEKEKMIMELHELREKYQAGKDENLVADCEAETHINMDNKMVKDTGKIGIDSSQRTVIKNLLENDYFEVQDYIIQGQKIVYIRGCLPLNCLRIKKEPKGKNTLYYILNH